MYNCYNKGKLGGAYYIGGISAHIGTGSEIVNCYNLADLTGNQEYCGGIVGYLRYTVNIDNCYNTGNLSGTSTYKGGIVGYIENDSSNNITINRCSYLTGTATTGIGYTADSSLSIEPSDTLPSVLSVINGDNAFVEDKDNINGGYPILSWQ